MWVQDSWVCGAAWTGVGSAGAPFGLGCVVVVVVAVAAVGAVMVLPFDSGATGASPFVSVPGCAVSASSLSASALALAAACWARLSGARTMIMLRPSTLGAASTLARSLTLSATRSRIFSPSSWWLISRPRNMIVIFTLWPSPRNLDT